MRLGRLILASLTALAAYSYAQAAPQPASAHDSLRVLQAVVPLLAHAADSISTAPAPTTPAHVVFTLDALRTTPLAGALFLLSSLLAIDLISRRHTTTFLRC